MQVKNILKTKKIPMLWVICVVLIYSLLMAEFFNTFNNKILLTQTDFSPNTIISYFMTFSYVVMVVMAFVIWIVSTFLFHLFAILFNGNAQYKDFQKLTGLSYSVSAVFFLVIIFMFDGVEITQNDIPNLFKINPTMKIIGWLMNIAGFTYYLLVIPIIKYLYNISWLKSLGVVAIPVGSIYLLGQLFSKFIF